MVAANALMASTVVLACCTPQVSDTMRCTIRWLCGEAIRFRPQQLTEGLKADTAAVDAAKESVDVPTPRWRGHLGRPGRPTRQRSERALLHSRHPASSPTPPRAAFPIAGRRSGVLHFRRSEPCTGMRQRKSL